MKKIACFLVVLLSFSLGSCSLDDGGPNFIFVPLQIVDVETPESFSLNQSYPITITYLTPDGCTAFEGFDVVEDGLTVRNVVAIGTTVNSEDVACTQVVEEKQASFQFMVLYNQSYTFRFWTGEDSNGDPLFLEVLIPVTQ